ncbi:MAG: PilX N-terminal domain-containing pilus assembly protein [Myxococcota bacterium]
MRTAARRLDRDRRDEGGIALITVVLVLALVSTLAVSAIEQTGQELQAGGRSRSATRALFAADAGIQLAMDRVTSPRDLTPIDFSLDDGTVSHDIQSRARDDAAPGDIGQEGFGEPPEGYSINLGSGFVNEVFKINITADSNPGNTLAEVEAKLGVLTSNGGSS